MSERTEFLRSKALEASPKIDNREWDYLFLKGYHISGADADITRRGDAKGYQLSHSTPVISDRELIVGKPFMGVMSSDKEEEYTKLKENGSMMIRLSGQASHMAVDYELLLAKGISGVRSSVENYRDSLDLSDPENIPKDAFYRACIAALDGVTAYAENYRLKALELASAEKDPVRRSELLDIADTLSVVPEYPAVTFRQALQSIHFLSVCLLNGLYQLGHPDRYLLPYYLRDTASGILNKEQALELASCVCILFNEYVSAGLAVGFMVGGRDSSGSDCSNELTRIFLESIDLTRMIYPGIGLCVNSDTPKDLLDLSCRLIGKGYSHPALFNDDIIIKGLMDYGLPYSHACEYIHSTCVEITPCKRSGVWVASPYHNLNGYLLDILSREDASELCPDFDSLCREYRNRLSEGIRREAIAQNKIQSERRLHGGNPLVSCFVDDCLAKGEDIDFGGAVYNWIMPSFVGLANLADSFIAVKALVYDNKELKISELYSVLVNNFEGNESLRQKILNRIDKYGNDSDLPDEMVKKISEWILSETPKYRTVFGSRFIPSMFCWIMHEMLGRETIATPDGRLAGFPFGDGSGPAQGREKNGPTASVISSTKWEHSPFIGGIAVNLKFSKSIFTDEMIPKLIRLIETYLDRGGFEIQINAVDAEILIDAKKHPEKYSDLVVRIGGYSDYFTRIGENMQNEIIMRSEHQL